MDDVLDEILINNGVVEALLKSPVFQELEVANDLNFGILIKVVEPIGSPPSSHAPFILAKGATAPQKLYQQKRIRYTKKEIKSF
ncbi:unnamed protein product [Lupinus luteus]|uniref:Uncharacterized protein n=1 Tax=Lupinus luteus TaxID=3873 RepID=A0AAV1VSQ6_LUPLU